MKFIVKESILLTLCFAFIFSFFGISASADCSFSACENCEKSDMPSSDAANAGQHEVNAGKCSSDLKDLKNLKLYAAGIPFGIQMKTVGATVMGLSEFKSGGKNVRPASDGGLRDGDIILKIDGKEIGGASDIAKRIGSGNGNSISVELNRAGKTVKVKLIPKKDDADSKFKLGVWLKDRTAGIGTVTYIVPDSLVFGGLGHGICDSHSGKPVSFTDGKICNVNISGVIRGLEGKPGEIRGRICDEVCGMLISNTECGAFGLYSAMPGGIGEEPMNVASKEEVKPGEAYIISTLENGKREKYSIEISEINKNETDTKNFTVKVTDKRLLEKTGGIIQGMSGSPIIQNGKLIGAVTHVLINDPTCGYGIYIENMLKNTPVSAQ